MDTKQNIRVIDDFWTEDIQDKIAEGMLTSEFPWHFCENIVEEYPTDNFQFVHGFYRSFAPASTYWENFLSLDITRRLDVAAWIRVKANLLTRTSEIIPNPLHVDNHYPGSVTAIYYVNTNNGYTFFDTGEQISSVKGRMLIFPTHYKHSGTTCTDAKHRTVINFNFFPATVPWTEDSRATVH